MGVTNLWPVLEPVQVHHTLSSLKGQTLAVDLSIWVCETQCVRQMQGVVSKPYLRSATASYYLYITRIFIQFFVQFSDIADKKINKNPLKTSKTMHRILARHIHLKILGNIFSIAFYENVSNVGMCLLYCRNLFFRISHLLQLGVHLVFVIEGSAPELKQQVMAKRQESRYPHKKVVGGQRKGGRRNFNACLKEVRF